MKLFIALIAGAFILGGFIGAEITNSRNDFSVAWGTAGAATVVCFIFGMGAFFDAQDHKRKRELQKNSNLTPEIVEVFDRMLGVNREAGETPIDALKKRQEQYKYYSANKKIQNNIDDAYEELSMKVFEFFSNFVIHQVVMIIPINKLGTVVQDEALKKTFSQFMKNKEALGYIFGAYDFLSQRIGLLSYGNDKVVDSMEEAYMTMWGISNGESMISLSLKLQGDEFFKKGRMQGGNEALVFLTSKMETKPTGLVKILTK